MIMDFEPMSVGGAQAGSDNPFPIEKGIPVAPDPRTIPKYQWGKMEVGDSFLIPGKECRSISNLTAAAGRRLGTRYIARNVDGGVRIWRTA